MKFIGLWFFLKQKVLKKRAAAFSGANWNFNSGAWPFWRNSSFLLQCGNIWAAFRSTNGFENNKNISYFQFLREINLDPILENSGYSFRSQQLHFFVLRNTNTILTQLNTSVVHFKGSVVADYSIFSAQFFRNFDVRALIAKNNFFWNFTVKTQTTLIYYFVWFFFVLLNLVVLLLTFFSFTAIFGFLFLSYDGLTLLDPILQLGMFSEQSFTFSMFSVILYLFEAVARCISDFTYFDTVMPLFEVFNVVGYGTWFDGLINVLSQLEFGLDYMFNLNNLVWLFDNSVYLHIADYFFMPFADQLFFYSCCVGLCISVLCLTSTLFFVFFFTYRRADFWLIFMRLTYGLDWDLYLLRPTLFFNSFGDMSLRSLQHHLGLEAGRFRDAARMQTLTKPVYYSNLLDSYLRMTSAESVFGRSGFINLFPPLDAVIRLNRFLNFQFRSQSILKFLRDKILVLHSQINQETFGRNYSINRWRKAWLFRKLSVLGERFLFFEKVRLYRFGAFFFKPRTFLTPRFTLKEVLVSLISYLHNFLELLGFRTNLLDKQKADFVGRLKNLVKEDVQFVEGFRDVAFLGGPTAFAGGVFDEWYSRRLNSRTLKNSLRLAFKPNRLKFFSWSHSRLFDDFTFLKRELGFFETFKFTPFGSVYEHFSVKNENATNWFDLMRTRFLNFYVSRVDNIGNRFTGFNAKWFGNVSPSSSTLFDEFIFFYDGYLQNYDEFDANFSRFQVPDIDTYEYSDDTELVPEQQSAEGAESIFEFGVSSKLRARDIYTQEMVEYLSELGIGGEFNFQRSKKFLTKWRHFAGFRRVEYLTTTAEELDVEASFFDDISDLYWLNCYGSPYLYNFWGTFSGRGLGSWVYDAGNELSGWRYRVAAGRYEFIFSRYVLQYFFGLSFFFVIVCSLFLIFGLLWWTLQVFFVLLLNNFWFFWLCAQLLFGFFFFCTVACGGSFFLKPILINIFVKWLGGFYGILLGCVYWNWSGCSAKSLKSRLRRCTSTQLNVSYKTRPTTSVLFLDLITFQILQNFSSLFISKTSLNYMFGGSANYDDAVLNKFLAGQIVARSFFVYFFELPILLVLYPVNNWLSSLSLFRYYWKFGDYLHRSTSRYSTKFDALKLDTLVYGLPLLGESFSHNGLGSKVLHANTNMTYLETIKYLNHNLAYNFLYASTSPDLVNNFFVRNLNLIAAASATNGFVTGCGQTHNLLDFYEKNLSFRNKLKYYRGWTGVLRLSSLSRDTLRKKSSLFGSTNFRTHLPTLGASAQFSALLEFFNFDPMVEVAPDFLGLFFNSQMTVGVQFFDSRMPVNGFGVGPSGLGRDNLLQTLKYEPSTSRGRFRFIELAAERERVNDTLNPFKGFFLRLGFSKNLLNLTYFSKTNSGINLSKSVLGREDFYDVFFR